MHPICTTFADKDTEKSRSHSLKGRIFLGNGKNESVCFHRKRRENFFFSPAWNEWHIGQFASQYFGGIIPAPPSPSATANNRVLSLNLLK